MLPVRTDFKKFAIIAEINNYTYFWWIENKISPKVKFIGYKNNPYKYIKYSNIFILSSRFEGLPNVLLEALLLKKYIISSNCPTGPAEILLNGKAGDLFKVGDYKELSQKIINFNRKKAMNKIKIGQNTLNRFDYKKNCNKYLELVKKYL